MMLQYKLSGHKTKRIVFEDAFSVLDSASLEQLKELTAKRRFIEESINQTRCITEATAREMHGGLTSRRQQDLLRLEQYLPLLANLILQVESVSASQSINQQISYLKVQWTSALSSSSAFMLKGPKFYQIDSLKYELGMTLIVYGVTLRERAFEVLSEDLQQCASLLKSAAGVYSYLNDEVLPSLQPILPPEQPAEATTTLSSIMALMCLAEAQAIAIKKAETMEISAGALAKLHYGVSQFLVEASALLQSLSCQCKDISGSFVEFIHTCRTLHELRSCKHLAESYRQSDELGIAIGLLRRALATVPKNTPSEPSWRMVFKQEVKDISNTLEKYTEENGFGWRRKIPLDSELPALEGAKMATPIPYVPQKWEREIAFKT